MCCYCYRARRYHKLPMSIMLMCVSEQAWYDYRLSWNTSEYGGVDNIRLPSNLVWTPDILLYNRCSLRRTRFGIFFRIRLPKKSHKMP